MAEEISIEKVCVLAGKVMLSSGAETYRVEDTMNRIAFAYGIENPQSYATPTGISFSRDIAATSHFLRTIYRTTNLNKIEKVNSISRQITTEHIDLKVAYFLLQRVDQDQLIYPGWLQITIAALASGCFNIMFDGTWVDFLPAFIIGGVGFSTMILIDYLVEIRFIAEFTASLVIGFLAVLFVSIGIGMQLDKIIISAVMPLVPGLHITNAIRDLLAGHLVSGLSKGVEAIITAFAIGAGVAVVFGII